MGGCELKRRAVALLTSRWLVFVGAMWVQSSAGTGYMFGSMSPVIKTTLGYNQRQIAGLGVAKDAGDFIGFFAGTLCTILPFWAGLLVGAIKNLLGYGWVWLIVTGRVPALPFWGMCILIFVGTNGETYFNTISLVSCVQNFPQNRGPVVGILKGFSGLSGAILAQIYAMIHAPDQASLIFMVAIGPSMIVIALMFIVRPVGRHTQIRASDNSCFMFIYIWCLLLAAYLMGVMLLEDLADLSKPVISLFTVVLLVLLLVPIVIPLLFTFYLDDKSPAQEYLLPASQKEEIYKSGPSTEHSEIMFSEVEDEKPDKVGLVAVFEKQKMCVQLQEKLIQAAAVGGASVKTRGSPRRGEDFTLVEALVKADFWLLFMSLLLGTGSGLVVIDNLGQISQALGYGESHIFVSMISIWNFLGRIAGGYFSEIIVRENKYPRPVALAVAQTLMAVGYFFIAMAWPGTMYIGTFLVGIPYGAHWAIVPATASELFGLKHFGALYNFLAVATPIGSFIFSGLIASSIYDYEAEKQSRVHQSMKSLLGRSLSGRIVYAEEQLKCEGAVCFYLASLIMSGVCIVAAVLSIVLVHRTKTVYANLYSKAGA